jgi:hypothetical protein
VELIKRAARKPVQPDEYYWSVVLRAFCEGHPHAPEMMRRLSDPLPGGFIAISLLNTANRLALEDELRPHAFDTPQGHRRLEAWLASSDRDLFNYAHSATVSLPFISPPARDRLLALAMDHADVGVQIEAAWASAKLGSEAGVKLLARFAEVVDHAKLAQCYLQEIGRGDAIPATARDANFLAMADICSWLGHPNEFGRSPDEITLYDTRELYWPPTDDRRRVWLFRYRCRAQEKGAADEVGLGMVGSVTFALFGEATGELSPDDAYGLHCCWELQRNDDPRAPVKRSAAAGRRFLEQHE